MSNTNSASFAGSLKEKLFFFINQYTLFTSLILVSVLSLIVFWPFLSGEGFYLYLDVGSDTANVYFPKYYEVVESILNGSFSWWSSQKGLGAPFFSASALIFDPFNLIFLIVGEDKILDSLVYIAIFRILVSVFLIDQILKLIGLSSMPRILGALLMALNGYSILWGQHYHLATGMVFLLAIILAAERLIRNEGWLLMTFLSVILALFSFLHLFIISTFVSVFVYCRCKMLSLSLRETIHREILTIFAVTMGVFLAAPFLLAWLDFFLQSARNASVAINPFSFHSLDVYVSFVLRLISNDALGTGNLFFGYYNYYEAPIVYSGLITLLLVPQLFSNLNKNEKIGVGILLVFSALTLLLPVGTLAMTGFAKALFFRHSFIFVFTLVFLASISFDRLIAAKHFNTVLAWKTFIALGLLLFLAVYLGKHYLGWTPAQAEISVGYFKAFLLVSLLYIFIISFLINKSIVIGFVALILLVGMELTFMASESTARQGYANSEYMQSHSNLYFTDAKVAASWLADYDNGLYRVEKSIPDRSLNDAQVQGYMGLRYYVSVSSSGIERFFQSLGFSDSAKRFWFHDLTSHIAITSILGVKYFVLRNTDTIPLYLEKIKSFGTVSLYKNPNAYPFGSIYRRYIDEENFKKMPRLERELTLLDTVVLDADSNEEYVKKREHFFVRNHFEKRTASGSLKVDFDPVDSSENFLFLDFNAKLPLGSKVLVKWSSQIQGEPLQSHRIELKPDVKQQHYLVQIGDEGIVSNLRIQSDRSQELDNIEVSSISKLLFKSFSETHQEEKLMIKKWAGDFIEGSIRLDTPGFIFLPIPYDPSWNLYVDGKSREIEKTTFGFIGAPLESGQHEIKLFFRPRTLGFGMTVCLIGLVLIFVAKVRHDKSGWNAPATTDTA